MTRSTLLLLLLILAAPHPGKPQELFMNQPGTLPSELEPVYLKGIAYLLKTQEKDGSWTDNRYGGRANLSTQPAITGLAIMALLAHGEDPNDGPYAPSIRRGLNYLLKQQDPKTGYIGPSMYNHGFATLALAEAYGAVDDPRLGPALEKAVALSLASQARNPEGAWRYSPESKDADTTISGAIFVSLIAARNAGLAIPEDAIRKALTFYKRCATRGGGFGYTGPDHPSAPRNAIGVLVFALAREKEDPAFKAALPTLTLETPPESSYPFYYEYYAAQALFQADFRRWSEWNLANLKRLAAMQGNDGAWDGQHGPTFSTAAALLSLALNYRLLPIYER
jgi:hypothetical protein